MESTYRPSAADERRVPFAAAIAAYAAAVAIIGAAGFMAVAPRQWAAPTTVTALSAIDGWELRAQRAAGQVGAIDGWELALAAARTDTTPPFDDYAERLLKASQ